MATISENLQTIKNSTNAIKQAIIDKGGEISGDITTFADAINGISGGVADDDKYTFIGSKTISGSKVTITGSLDRIPTEGRSWIVAAGTDPKGLIYSSVRIGANSHFTLQLDFGEPVGSDWLPALFLICAIGGFYEAIKFYVNDIEYDALSQMTWEQFVNSNVYNPQMIDANGLEYKQFLINGDYVYYTLLYEGEVDYEVNIYIINEDGRKSLKISDIIESGNIYIAD